MTRLTRAMLAKRGRLILPGKIREFLRVKPGDPVHFVIDEGGRVIVRAESLRALKGLLRRPGHRPISVEEMDVAVGRFASKKKG